MTKPLADFRDAIFAALLPLAAADERVVLITNDMGAQGLKRYREICPARLVNGGVAEQNIMSVAAGLAMAGMRPFVFGIAAHITNRCYEQIKLDIAATRQPVVLLGMGGGLSYGADGPSHHSMQDTAILRAIPNLCVYQPADPGAAEALVRFAYAAGLPAYIRLDKEQVANLETAQDLAAGCELVKPGQDSIVVATGILVHRALEIAHALEREGKSVAVVNCFRLNPFPEEALAARIADFGEVFALEEHARTGGLAEALAATIARRGFGARFRSLTLPDSVYFGSASRRWAHAREGLDAKGIARALSGRD